MGRAWIVTRMWFAELLLDWATVVAPDYGIYKIVITSGVAQLVTRLTQEDVFR